MEQAEATTTALLIPSSVARSDSRLAVSHDRVASQVTRGSSNDGMKASTLAMIGILSTSFGYLGGTISVPRHQQALSMFSETVVSNGTEIAINFHQWATTPTNGETCPAGLMLPSVAATPVNAVIYLLLLFWTFLGVAIGADVFMMAIEFITSAETISKVRVDGGLRSFSVLVWNPTIANLTLMALGSSAPEILLSVIEIVTGGFYAGELGPSTIVGSAAFNLMVISAVCVVTIPDGESRKIKELPVFYITATFSVLAYLWLIVILVVTSPNIITIWEGITTFLLFPFLVWLAYLADIKAGCFSQREANGEGGKLVAITREGRPVTADDISRAYALVKDSAEGDVSEAVRDLLSGPKSKAFYKLTASTAGSEDAIVGATKAAVLGGGPRKSTTGILNTRKSSLDPGKVGKIKGDVKVSSLTFECSSVSVPGSNGWCELVVKRSGALEAKCEVAYRVEDMGALQRKAPDVAGSLSFEPYQDERVLRFKLVADTSTYGVFLENPSMNAQLGAVPICWVAVSQGLEQGAGVLSFESESLACKESEGELRVAVLRSGGNSKAVSVRVATSDGSAIAPCDYVAIDQTLFFAEGEVRKEVSITIIDDGKYENDEKFQVVLSEPSDGASFMAGDHEDGTRAILEVTIISDEETRSQVDQLLAVINFDLDVARLGGADWGTQFSEALELPDDAYDTGIVLAALVYLIVLPFKLAFALPPPPRIGGGWACFVAALGLIGALTALIGDLANHVGCCFGMSASTTAITLVALGTSLPDTFASMAAAKQEPYADASIGNITGSNSVNVFLGLGLPWAIAAMYWASMGDAQAWHARYVNEPWYTPGMSVGFAVPAGSLAYSVGIFTACAVATLGTLMARRSFLGYELGGKTDGKLLTAALFVALWLVYIALSIAGGAKSR